MYRSQRELSNAYFLAKTGFDTAENEPSKVCPIAAPFRVRSGTDRIVQAMDKHVDTHVAVLNEDALCVFNFTVTQNMTRHLSPEVPRVAVESCTSFDTVST